VEASTDLVDRFDGVHLCDLPQLTTLLVWTSHSLYRLIVSEGSHVYLQGGAYFPDPTAAHVDGASSGRSGLKAGRIEVGLPMEIRAGIFHITTSPVRAIVTARSGPTAIQ
jgi:hypothetical protein